MERASSRMQKIAIEQPGGLHVERGNIPHRRRIGIKSSPKRRDPLGDLTPRDGAVDQGDGS